MAPTSAEMQVARSWIGTTEEDDVFAERYDRLGAQYGFDTALDRAVEESLRAQLASLTLDQPSSITVGDLSLSFGQNIIALQANLKQFLASGGTTGNVRIARLYRRDPVR